MKFNCGPTIEERIAREQEWHRWFAWFPVRVEDKSCRWLEHVERRYVYHYIRFVEYRGIS